MTRVEVLSRGAETLVNALDGRKTGGGWMARCPAHHDRDPSLSIREAEDGKILIYCHAGCDQEHVIAALRSRGLWPDNGPGPSKRLALHAAATTQPDRDDTKRLPCGTPQSQPRVRSSRRISRSAVSVSLCRRRSASVPV